MSGQESATAPEFRPWPKIPRWNRGCFITEKIDGTNACVVVTEHGEVFAQSRTRIITPESDNFGFARWVHEHADELAEGLGEGYHYGEWFGSGIQRRYGLDEKLFALFNIGRWKDERPACCEVVPVLWTGPAGEIGQGVDESLTLLREKGSIAVPGFMRPEGIVIYFSASRTSHKVMLEGDNTPKALAA